MVTVSETQPAPLRRDRSRAVVGGVCAGLARRLGVDPLIVRVCFVVAAGAAGLGVGALLVGDRFADWNGPGRRHDDGFDELEIGTNRAACLGAA